MGAQALGLAKPLGHYLLNTIAIAGNRFAHFNPPPDSPYPGMPYAFHFDASLYARFVDQVKRGETLGPEVSVLKIWAMEAWQRVTDLLLEIGEEQGVMPGVQEVAGVEADFLNPFYYARPATIYGGSSEIQRNILAKYVLRLPG